MGRINFYNNNHSSTIAPSDTSGARDRPTQEINLSASAWKHSLNRHHKLADLIRFCVRKSRETPDKHPIFAVFSTIFDVLWIDITLLWILPAAYINTFKLWWAGSREVLWTVIRIRHPPFSFRRALSSFRRARECANLGESRADFLSLLRFRWRCLSSLRAISMRSRSQEIM